jgi:hypothetical protein
MITSRGLSGARSERRSHANRIIDDGGDGRSGSNRFARSGGDPLCERRYNLFEFRLLDQRNRLARLNPLDQPLFELRPSLALSFHEQREDFDLATHLDAMLVEQLVILEEADRFCPNPPSDAGFFKGFARGRFCRPQALDRPTFRNDPAFGTPRGDKEDFERGVWREPIGKSGVLDAKRRLDLPLSWLSANLTSPDSPASPATFWRLATQRIGGKDICMSAEPFYPSDDGSIIMCEAVSSVTRVNPR